MCGNDGFFHGPITNPSFGKYHRPKKALDPAVQAEIEAEMAANQRTAQVRRRRRSSSLLGAGNRVTGNPAVSSSPGGTILSQAAVALRRRGYGGG